MFRSRPRAPALPNLICALAVAGLGASACTDAVAPTPAKPLASSAFSVIPVSDAFGVSVSSRLTVVPPMAAMANLASTGIPTSLAQSVSAVASLDGVVMPNAYTTVMGNINNTFPHAWANMRYQQVFLGSEMGALRSVGAVCIRRDDGASGPAETQQLTVKMGPTARDNSNLSASFDDNYSDAPTPVFSGQVTLPASSGNGTPGDFYICVEFTDSYVHTPGRNVIIEIVNTSATSIPHFDDACLNTAACTTGRAVAFSATATTAGFVDRLGLVMKFIRGNPTTKDDCKNEGWENYGFVNQGQCVRFVETGTDSRSSSS